MWRYFVGALATLLMVGAGLLFMNKRASSGAALPAAPLAAVSGTATAGDQAGAPLPDTVPAATEKTREQKRFDRYDKDRNGTVTREEYLATRRKAFAKLDTNHDGALSFDEWAIKAETKFATADADRNGTLTAAEFATTRVQRRAPRRIKCPQPQPQAPAEHGEEDS